MAKDAANIVDIKNNSEYTEWISSICKRFKKSQIKASVRVNIEMLHFYWAVGRDIAEKSDQFGYGSAFYKTVSEDLQKVFPAVHSFSVLFQLQISNICAISLNCIQMQRIVNSL